MESKKEKNGIFVMSTQNKIMLKKFQFVVLISWKKYY